ncbi:protein delta homolog 1 [Sorex fumeus]|uniref:protein delta homolog 1 n=1 Tax=Sorex fumeus TaxID=62283 RepID=UPI0024AD54DE|nr:protein delta homolog 1 [Sorex fumeus]
MTATAALLPALLLLLASGPTAHGAECHPACHPQNGFCHDDNVCRCHPGWQGPLCDQCVTFPGCAHGFCVSPWECMCEDGWEGDLCDADVRGCISAPCANNGTCVNMEKGNYVCSCVPGFSGRDCGTKAGPCVINGSPCQHGGTCVDDDGRAPHASCLCPPGFSGNFCEIVASSCTPNPCENRGICTDIGGDFRCRCPAGFMDKTCSRLVSTCAAAPCLHGGTCVRHGPVRFECVCTPDFTGPLCGRRRAPGTSPATRRPPPPPQAEHHVLKVSVKELKPSAPLLSEGQTICFTVLGVLAGLLLAAALGVVFYHKCEGWMGHLRHHRLLHKKQNPLLQYSSGDDLAVNIIFPEKGDAVAFHKEPAAEADEM